MMNTGEKIKMLRKRAGMTQAELANRLGVRDAAVAKYETGRVTNLKRETIAKLSEVFDVSPIYLIDDDIIEIETTSIDTVKRNARLQYYDRKMSEIENVFSELTDEQRKKVLAYANMVKEGLL